MSVNRVISHLNNGCGRRLTEQNGTVLGQARSTEDLSSNRMKCQGGATFVSLLQYRVNQRKLTHFDH